MCRSSRQQKRTSTANVASHLPQVQQVQHNYSTTQQVRTNRLPQVQQINQDENVEEANVQSNPLGPDVGCPVRQHTAYYIRTNKNNKKVQSGEYRG